MIALNSDGAPATVICRTCGEQHRYRPRRPGESAATRKSSAGGGTRVRAASARSRVEDVPAGPTRPYSPRETYAEGEWVEHSKFGAGRVTSTREGKIEVKFNDGVRLLIHAG
ncbi:MAG TPA: hypothetical protein VEY09_17945 [Pyrinomonadaceae bacterium]|nr:hypothetical protein [Pyrinomonadaceae bacterium]